MASAIPGALQILPGVLNSFSASKSSTDTVVIPQHSHDTDRDLLLEVGSLPEELPGKESSNDTEDKSNTLLKTNHFIYSAPLSPAILQ